MLLNAISPLECGTAACTQVQNDIGALYNGAWLSWRLQGPSNPTAQMDTVRFSADARGYVCKPHAELYDLMCSQLSVRESCGMHLLKAIKRTGKDILGLSIKNVNDLSLFDFFVVVVVVVKVP